MPEITRFGNLTRAELMSRIKGRGNKKTELRMAELFREHGITGWRRHQDLPGRPDFVFRRVKVAVFVDGCFWHGCPRHFRVPRTRTKFWMEKIRGNKARDRRVSRELRASGWKVLRVWECALTKARAPSTVARVSRALERGSG